jgi:hypothetical protein
MYKYKAMVLSVGPVKDRNARSQRSGYRDLDNGGRSRPDQATCRTRLCLDPTVCKQYIATAFGIATSFEQRPTGRLFK